MNLRIIVLLFFIFPFTGKAETSREWVKVSDDIKVTRLTEKAYLYVATSEIRGFGLVPSNGVILVEGKKAFLFDTPINNEQTETLVNWISGTLHAKLTGFVPNHWHGDCIGGLGYLQKIGVKSYANQMTINAAKKEHKPVPDQGFTDSLALKLGKTDILCYYLGGGHTADNIVVWFPSENILFGGCFVKDMQAKNLGNLSDAVVSEWPASIERTMKKFPTAKVVIPGHGDIGGLELLTHTRDLLLRAK